MKLHALIVVAALFAAAPLMSQQSKQVSVMPYAGSQCTDDGGVKASAEQIEIFHRFDSELRSALKRNDTAMLALIVRLPLRINTNRGTVLIPDAHSLDGHYRDIFPPPLRDAVLSTLTRSDYICRYDEGVAYKDGVLWASTDGKAFAIDAVNVPDEHPDTAVAGLAFTCKTKFHRIVIDQLADGNLRYRSWNEPRSLIESPDLEIAAGNRAFEGTGVCSYATYTFRKGSITYEVDQGLGCGDGSEPANATGNLTVIDGAKTVTKSWCF